jgi:hypothetical protein
MGTLNSVYVISCKGHIVHREEETVLGSFEVPYRSVEEKCSSCVTLKLDSRQRKRRVNHIIEKLTFNSFTEK